MPGEHVRKMISEKIADFYWHFKAIGKPLWPTEQEDLVFEVVKERDPSPESDPLTLSQEEWPFLCELLQSPPKVPKWFRDAVRGVPLSDKVRPEDPTLTIQSLQEEIAELSGLIQSWKDCGGEFDAAGFAKPYEDRLERLRAELRDWMREQAKAQEDETLFDCLDALGRDVPGKDGKQLDIIGGPTKARLDLAQEVLELADSSLEALTPTLKVTINLPDVASKIEPRPNLALQRDQAGGTADPEPTT